MIETHAKLLRAIVDLRVHHLLSKQYVSFWWWFFFFFFFFFIQVGVLINAVIGGTPSPNAAQGGERRIIKVCCHGDAEHHPDGVVGGRMAGIHDQKQTKRTNQRADGHNDVHPDDGSIARRKARPVPRPGARSPPSVKEIDQPRSAAINGTINTGV